MAIIDNPMFKQVTGTVGRQIVYKKYYDKTVISKKPDMSRRILSEKQLESNARMRLANDYARLIYSTEEGKMQARIRLKVPPHKSLYHAVVKAHLDENRHIPLAELDK